MNTRSSMVLQTRSEGRLDGQSPLTVQQRRVLRFIQDYMAENSYQPSIREIADGLNLRSSGSVHFHLRNLERMGVLRREAPRGLQVSESVRVPDEENVSDPSEVVPLLSRIVAGEPLFADANVEAWYRLPRSFTGTGSVFVWRVEGDSMASAGILPGDWLVVRQQSEAEKRDTCLAWIDGEVQLGNLRMEESQPPMLEPGNQPHPSIQIDDTAWIVGKVVAVIRSLL